MRGRWTLAGAFTIEVVLSVDQTLQHLFVDDEGGCSEHKFEVEWAGPLSCRAAGPKPYIPPLLVVCVVVVELAGGGPPIAGEEVVLSSVVVVVDEAAGIELSLAHPAKANNPTAASGERISVFIEV